MKLRKKSKKISKETMQAQCKWRNTSATDTFQFLKEEIENETHLPPY